MCENQAQSKKHSKTLSQNKQNHINNYFTQQNLWDEIGGGAEGRWIINFPPLCSPSSKPHLSIYSWLALNSQSSCLSWNASMCTTMLTQNYLIIIQCKATHGICFSNTNLPFHSYLFFPHRNLWSYSTITHAPNKVFCTFIHRQVFSTPKEENRRRPTQNHNLPPI